MKLGMQCHVNPKSSADLELGMCKILRVTNYHECVTLRCMSRQTLSYRILKTLTLCLLRHQQRGKGLLIWAQSSDGGAGTHNHPGAHSWVTRGGTETSQQEGWRRGARSTQLCASENMSLKLRF